MFGIIGGKIDWHALGRTRSVLATLVTHLDAHGLCPLLWGLSWTRTDCARYFGDSLGRTRSVLATLGTHLDAHGVCSLL